MKRSLKTLVCLTFALVLSISAVACNSTAVNSSNTNSASSSSTIEKKEVVKLSLLTNVDSYLTGWEAVVKDIEANKEKNGFEIEVEKIAGGTDGEAVLKARFASGELPDVMQAYGVSDVNQNLGGLKNIVALDGMSWIQNFDEKVLQAPEYSAGGKIYGVPFGAMDLAGMFYNKKVFSSLNIQVPTTWAELLTAAEKIKAAGITPFYYAGKDSWTLQMIPLVGFNRFFKDKSQVEWFNLVNTNKAKLSENTFYLDSFKKLNELKEKGFINKNFLTDTYEDSQKALVEGTTAMIPEATWMLDAIAAKYPNNINDIGGFAIPFDGNDKVVSWNAGAMVITSACKKMEAAKALINYLGSKETQQIYFTAQPGLPMIKGVVVSTLPTANQELYKIFTTGRGIGNWQTFTKFDMGYDLAKSCQDILVGAKTPDQLIKLTDETYPRDAKNKNDPNFQ